MKLTVFACVMAVAATAAAESSSPSFETALIKPNFSAAPPRINVQADGRFEAVNIPLSLLITAAYRIGHDSQLVGLPLWVRDARYDIFATAPSGVVPGELAGSGEPSPVQLMLRALLVKDFGLKTHTDTRDLLTYSLVTLRADKSLGPNLKPSHSDCVRIETERLLEHAAPTPMPPAGAVRACMVLFVPGRIAFGAQPLDQLAAFLGDQVDRVVVDRTDLPGQFDFDLTWSYEQPLLTAIREQLGLKLESTKASVEVTVVDSIMRPPIE